MHCNGDNSFLCDHFGCERSVPGQGFPRQWNLKDHKRRVHPENNTLLPAMKFPNGPQASGTPSIMAHNKDLSPTSYMGHVIVVPPAPESVDSAEVHAVSPSSHKTCSLDESALSGSDTSSHTLTTAVLGNRGNELFDNITTFFEKLIDSKLRRCQETGDGSRTSQGSPSSGEGVYTAGGNTQGGRNGKRARTVGDSDPGKQDDDQDGEDQRNKRTKTGEPRKQRIACPFAKRYPAEFSARRYCSAPPGFDGIHRMKYEYLTALVF